MRLLWIRPPIPNNNINGGGLLYSPHALHHPDALTSAPTAHSTLARRLIRLGERKWSELGAAPSDSLRGQIYKLGGRLISRLPVQEKMWWRVESNMQDGGGGVVEIEHGGVVAEHDKQQLLDRLGHYMRQHRVRWIANTVLSVPVAALTILPFVKLVLAWVIFRAVTHHRAYQGCKYLVGRLPGAVYRQSDFVSGLERRLGGGGVVGGDLSDVDADLRSALIDRFGGKKNGAPVK